MRKAVEDSGHPTVPILLYHAVTSAPGNHIAPFTVAPPEFRRQLDRIVEAGLRCLTFSELVDEVTRSGPAGHADLRDAVVVTFDDGYADFAEHALPALHERGLRSTLYVTTGWLEGRGPREPGPSDRMLDWGQLPELVDQGVEIGAHSHTHPQMDTLGAWALADELRRPKGLLEETLGERVRSFAYPHGYNGPRVRRATRQAGYDSAAAVRDRSSPYGEDVRRFSRLTVKASTTADELASWLRSRQEGPARYRESLRTTAGRAYRRGGALLRGRPGSVYA